AKRVSSSLTATWAKRRARARAPCKRLKPFLGALNISATDGQFADGMSGKTPFGSPHRTVARLDVALMVTSSPLSSFTQERNRSAGTTIALLGPFDSGIRARIAISR